MSKICFGCGVKLQSTDTQALGYVPIEKLEDSKYCQRCFKLIHYGSITGGNEPKSISEIVKTVNKNAKHVVFLVDFINVFDEVINIFKSIKVPKILVISKSDIIPKNISFKAIRDYLIGVYKIRDEIIFTSNKSNLNTLIKSLYGMEEVYFLGLTNAGKSSLINTMLDKLGSKNAKLTTSFKENTTRDFVRIKIDDKLTIIDSPGFVINNFDADKFTNIKSEIKPITYQNKIKCAYKIDDLLTVGLNGTTSAIFYFSKNIKIKRDYKKFVSGITFKVDANSDIVICGLGFIKVTTSCEIIIEEDIMKYINIRPSITGGHYED